MAGGGGWYLAGEGACALSLGLGVLHSAVLVGVKHSSCKNKKRSRDPPKPSGRQMH